MSVEVITSSQLWECPADVISVVVECIGGGGSGGGVSASGTASTGGGGAGGSYAKKTLTVVPGNNYNIVVGAGGVGSAVMGNNGGDSYFGSAYTVLAKGGQGGGRLTAIGYNSSRGIGSTTGCIGEVVRKGGDGSFGSWEDSYSGAGGGAAAAGSNGNNAVQQVGGAAISPYSGKGGNGITTASNGVAGNTYGGGGSGGMVFVSTVTPKYGGNGGAGVVILTYVTTGNVEISSNLRTDSEFAATLSKSSSNVTISSELRTDSEIFANLLVSRSISIPPSSASKIANIKITVNDVLRNWWKLNYFTDGVVLGIPFENFLRNVLIRNTSLDNWDLTGETRFTIVSHDTVNKKIVISPTIPDMVTKGVEAFGSTYNWMLMKDYGCACLIDYIDIGLNEITYTGSITSVVSGPYVAGDIVTFFNPFMNYNFEIVAPTLALGSTWNSLGIQCGGMWQGVDGDWRMIVVGTQTSNPIRCGLAKSSDLITWTYENGGDYLYAGGEGVFDIPGVSIANTNVFSYSNPIKLADNSYLIFFNTNPSSGIAAITPVYFDDDFIITSVGSCLDIPDYPADYIQQAGGAVYFEGNYHLYLIDRGSSNVTTWKIVEAIIPDLNTMEVTESHLVIEWTGNEAWNGKHMDMVVPFVWNDTIYLWVSGTGNDPYPNSILQGNREMGLVKRISSTNFEVDHRNPLLMNPINGGYTWDPNMTACGDHTGGGHGLWFTEDILHIFCTMNASSNTYKIWHVKIPLEVPTTP